MAVLSSSSLRMASCKCKFAHFTLCFSVFSIDPNSSKTVIKRVIWNWTCKRCEFCGYRKYCVLFVIRRSTKITYKTQNISLRILSSHQHALLKPREGLMAQHPYHAYWALTCPHSLTPSWKRINFLHLHLSHVHIFSSDTGQNWLKYWFTGRIFMVITTCFRISFFTKQVTFKSLNTFHRHRANRRNTKLM